MKFKSKIMFISLIMLILLSVTCVSATQDLDVNSTLETDDSISEEVTSSQVSEEIEVQSTEVELENDDDVLGADGGEAIGERAESDDVLGAADGSIAQQIETNVDGLALDDNGDVLGISTDDSDVLQFPHNLKYILLPTFSGITLVVDWFQKSYRHDEIHLIFAHDKYRLLTAVDKPITFVGGNDPNIVWKVDFNFQYNGQRSVLDALGKCALVNITRNSNYVFFKDMEFTNSVVGGIFINTACRSTIEFENCVFRNITGGAIVIDSAADVIIRNCTFENVDSKQGSAIRVNNDEASVKISDSKFVNTKAEANLEAVNGPGNILTISFNSKENYIGAIYSLGNVQLNNVEYWDGIRMVNTNNVPSTNTLKNKTVVLSIKTKEGNVSYTLKTDDNGQIKFNYADFASRYGHGNYYYELTFSGDNYAFPSNFSGNFQTRGEFTYLQDLINNASENGVVKLNSSITYNDVLDRMIVAGVVINKPLTIDGNGNIIDARGFSRIFDVQSSDVTIKNIVLFNGVIADSDGGAIRVAGSNCKMENVTFMWNEARSGGAIAISSGENNIISNCLFAGNKASNDGGAIYITNAPRYTKIGQDSRFINNSAGNGGGAIYDFASETTIDSSDFNSNHASRGGAIYKTYYALDVANSNFSYNVAERGGAVHVDGYATGSIKTSSFRGNRANIKEFFVVDETYLNRLNITLNGEDNYIHAIYADGMAEISFNNVSYWDEGWKNTDGNPISKSSIAAFQKVKVIILDKDSEQYLIEDYTTDANGQFIFLYAAFDDGNYTYKVQHIEDSYYAFGEKTGTIEVKPGTFTDLKNLIGRAHDGDVVNLTKDYVYSPDVDGAITDGIEINKTITINGYGNTIDAKGQTRIFRITQTNVKINQTIFENGKNVNGSAILIDYGGYGAKINNCIFANTPGTAIYSRIGYDGARDVNDNWFGTDWTNYNVKPSTVNDLIDVDRWYFLNITLNRRDAFLSLNYKYIASQEKTVIDENCKLPLISFAFNATDNIKFKENITENITLDYNTTFQYSLGEQGAIYGVPIGMTLKYKDKAFTQTRIFNHEMHITGIPNVIDYKDVLNWYQVIIYDTFGEEWAPGNIEFTIHSVGKVINYQKGGFKIDIRDNYTDSKGNAFRGLRVGNYTYTVSSGQYSFLGNVSVVGTPTTVIFRPIEDTYVGEAKRVLFYVRHPSALPGEYGTIRVYINGNVSVYDVEPYFERSISIDVTNYPYGVNNVTIQYLDNEDSFFNTFVNMSFRVMKYESKIKVDAPDSIGYYEDLVFKINVTHQTSATYRFANSENETLKEGDVDENEVVIPGSLLVCGDYTLTVNNEETFNISGSTLTKKITVSKITPTMLVNYTIDGADVNITVDIDSDATGGILFNNEYVAIVNGSASYIKHFNQGYQVVNVTYQTDRADVFNQVNKSVSFYIVNTNSTLKHTPIEVIVESAGNFVFLTAKINETATGFVMFSVDGNSTFMPIIDGEANHYEILEAGTYNVLVIYTGDSKFNGNSTVKTIVVNDPIKKNTTITPKVDIDGNNVEITVNINENATGYVAFTVDENTYNVDVFLGEAVFKGKFNEGTHVIGVEYLGDDEFESNSTAVTFTIEKPALKNTTVGIRTAISERNVELFLTFDVETNGFALIDINGTRTYVKVDSGVAYYRTTLGPGDYNVTVTYMGDDKFNPAQTSSMISIERPAIKDANFTLYVSVFGQEVFIIMDIDSDATGIILLEINDTAIFYDLKGENEAITFSTKLPRGTYDITAIYSGDDYYNFDMQGETIEIVPTLNTTIEARSEVNENTVTITVEIDANATGFVEISVVGKKFYVPVVDGVAKFENNYDKGNYVADVIYLGDDMFNTNKTTVPFIVTETEPTLKNTTMDVNVSVSGNEVSVTVNVNETATGLVAFELNGDVMYLPINNGKVVNEYSLPIGHYNITVTYIGEGEFNSNKTTQSFDVVENSTSGKNESSLLKTVIFAPQVTTTYNGNGYLTITIKDENGNLVKSRTVEITINGKRKSVTTGANGVAKLSTNGLAPKTYTANIVFKSDGSYAKSTATAKVVIKKAASKITAKKKTFKKAKKTKKYKITLKSGKYAIKKVKVSLKVKGKTYNAKTNAKGKAVFKIKKLTKKGKFTAKINFKGNGYYKAVTKKVKITIK